MKLTIFIKMDYEIFGISTMLRISSKLGRSADRTWVQASTILSRGAGTFHSTRFVIGALPYTIPLMVTPRS